MVADGTLALENESDAFLHLMMGLPVEFRVAVYKKYRDQLSSRGDSAKHLQEFVLYRAFRQPSRTSCVGRTQQATMMAREISDFDPQKANLCLCLDGQFEVPKAERRKLVQTLFNDSLSSPCSSIQPDEWPEPYYDVKTPEIPAGGRRPPFASGSVPVDDQVVACLKSSTILERPEFFVLVEGRVASGQFRSKKVTTTLVGQSSHLSYKRDASHQPIKRGYVRRSDITRATAEVQACVENAVRSFTVPDKMPVAKEGRPRDIFIVYKQGRRFTARYTDEN